MYIHTHVSL